MDRVLSDPGFGDDTGDADPALAAALATGRPDAVWPLLIDARVLVPIIAILDEVDERGVEKSTDMAVVTLRTPDGKVALPAFTSLAALMSWHAEARPLPISGARACEATLFERADALVLDPAGPVTFVVDGYALRALAAGEAPQLAHADPEVRAVVTAALHDLADLEAAFLVPSDDADAVLALVWGADCVDPTASSTAFARGLVEHPVLRERLVRGLDIAVLPPGSELSTGRLR
ncbi:MAG TPA: SseB family protein [Sporichthyaceae bacterium]